MCSRGSSTKAGNITEARTAIEAALAVGTRDPLVAFHAAQVYRAPGDEQNSRSYLERVVAQKPHFRVLHEAARTMRDELNALRNWRRTLTRNGRVEFRSRKLGLDGRGRD